MFMYLFSEDCPKEIRPKFLKNEKCPVVYQFEDSAGCVLYVGKTTNFCSRWSQHFRSDKPILDVAKVRIFVYKDYSEASFVEAQLIARLKPSWNSQGKEEKVSKRKMKPVCEFTLKVLSKRLEEFRDSLNKEVIYPTVGPVHLNALSDEALERLNAQHPNCTFKVAELTIGEETRFKLQKANAKEFDENPVYLLPLKSGSVAHMWSDSMENSFCHMYKSRAMYSKNYRKGKDKQNHSVCKTCLSVHDTYSHDYVQSIEIIRND